MLLRDPSPHHVPLIDTSRARDELGWAPIHAVEAVSELLAGLRDGAEDRTPPLAPATSRLWRSRYARTGVSARHQI